MLLFNRWISGLAPKVSKEVYLNPALWEPTPFGVFFFRPKTGKKYLTGKRQSTAEVTERWGFELLDSGVLPAAYHCVEIKIA